MATTQNDEEQIRLIECPICDHKAKQQVNSPPRTICPKCGNFYVDSGEGPPPPRRLARERQERKNIPENEVRICHVCCRCGKLHYKNIDFLL